MNKNKRWLPVLMGLASPVLLHGLAAAQPKPITVCGTTISAPGSYVVTANLTATSTSVPCIRVTVGAVNIDLGGFTLTGKGGSLGLSASTGPVAIRSGIIKDFGNGIGTPPGAKLSNVTLIGNVNGAHLGGSALVTDSKFLNNSGVGLVVGQNALITHCTFVGNGGVGFFARGAGAVVTENVASGNGFTLQNGYAFETSGTASLSGNTASSNGSNGFEDAVGQSTFEGNTGSSNRGQGFAMGDQSVNSHAILGGNVFIGNSAVGNTLTGFADAGGSTFEVNTSDRNLTGFAGDAAGETFITNTADSNSEADFSDGFAVLCPSNVIGNTAVDNTSAFTTGGTVGCNVQINLGF